MNSLVIINHVIVQTLTAGWAVHDTERSYLENAKGYLGQGGKGDDTTLGYEFSHRFSCYMLG